jgi:hypothetical protein
MLIFSSCSVPFRLQNKLQASQSKKTQFISRTSIAENRIENVHLGSVQESVQKINNARVVIADYKLIKKDFSTLNSKTNDEIDKWLIDQVAYISKPQLSLNNNNTKISVTDRTRMAFRPPNYNRGLVYEMKHPETGEHLGLIDVQGSGVSNSTYSDNGRGIASLGESMREYVWENLIREVLADSSLSNKTVATYAVIDAGFDLINKDGTRTRAGFYLRQAHSHLNLNDNERTRLQNIFNKYGIDSNSNIKVNKNNDLVDFRNFIVRDDLINIDPEKQVPVKLWGYMKTYPIQTGDRLFYAKNDFTWNSSHEFAEAWARGHADREDATKHFNKLLMPARNILNNSVVK